MEMNAPVGARRFRALATPDARMRIVMSKKNKKQEKRRKKWVAGCEHKSDRRTADFLARELGGLQEQLCDLISDMRTFEHFSEIEDAGWCLNLMQRLKRKYRKFADDGTWPESA
jgi:hypothetical protein